CPIFTNLIFSCLITFTPKCISMQNVLIFLIGLAISTTVTGQQTIVPYIPLIEDCSCPVQIDSGIKARCGYLIVPENRNKPGGRTIRLPFVYAESPSTQKKEDVLFFS